jgi:predicted nucleic acid-binding protein
MEKGQIICDTDVIIDLFDRNQKRHFITKGLINEIGAHNVIVSAITKMEVIRGARSKEHLGAIKKYISDFELSLINHEITELALNLLLKYFLSHGLAISDSFIAATSIYTDYELFTYNTKDYKFIEGLKLYKYISAHKS